MGILTRNPDAYSSAQLQKALSRRHLSHSCFSFPQLIARIGYGNSAEATDVDASKLDGLIIRPIGRGSLEELVFRMDLLYRLQRSGQYVINPPEAIEHCVDKYDVLAILEENNISVPRTAVTENCGEALRAFRELGQDVIVKPIFGSRGVGATRINDPEVALTVFNAIRFSHGAVYVQEYVEHGFSDIRAFVVGKMVVAAMKRQGKNWKTNYSQGAKPVRIVLRKEVEDMAIRSATLIDCKIAGVDILESPKGPIVVDVNSQPGWRGLQSVTDTVIADKIVDFILSELRG